MTIQTIANRLGFKVSARAGLEVEHKYADFNKFQRRLRHDPEILTLAHDYDLDDELKAYEIASTDFDDGEPGFDYFTGGFELGQQHPHAKILDEFSNIYVMTDLTIEAFIKNAYRVYLSNDKFREIVDNDGEDK
jgi:hypothetical protein